MLSVYLNFTLLYLAVFIFTPAVRSQTSYANFFVNPEFIVAKQFNESSQRARYTIQSWAKKLAAEGPWTVVNKTMTPPSGDNHDYMSFSPYSWPDCSNVGNTTELAPEQVWITCPYVTRDGRFNPDARMVNNIGDFDDMADAVAYSTMSFVINNDATFAQNAVRFIRTWFLDPETRMNPNLNFAQMKRGPDGQNGTRTGVLDLKSMTKVVNGIMILRGSQASQWTSDLDTRMVEWTREYITWLQSAPIALEEAAAENNHGTFYYNQLAALQILVGDTQGARQTLESYFTELYPRQIAANGDQPLESDRTRPYHYRSYNLAGMITNARLGEYIGYSVWNLTTSAGATIKTALDYAVSQAPGDDDPSSLYPYIAAVGVEYGDPDKAYAKFLVDRMANGLLVAPFHFWDELDLSGVSPGSTKSVNNAKPTDRAVTSSALLALKIPSIVGTSGIVLFGFTIAFIFNTM